MNEMEKTGLFLVILFVSFFENAVYTHDAKMVIISGCIMFIGHIIFVLSGRRK